MDQEPTPVTAVVKRDGVHTKHHQHSPSQLRNFELCARFLPEKSDRTNEAADEGTALHAACETEVLIGLDMEQREAVSKCLAYIDTLPKPEGTKDYREYRVSVPRITRGTIDRLIIRPDGVAYLIDYKFGRNPVDLAKDNLQGQAYALGVFHKFPLVHSIAVVFLCPRQLEDDQPHVYRRADIPTIMMRIASVKAAARSKTAPYTPNPSACARCGRKTRCPALIERAALVAQAYGGLPAPTHFDPGSLVSPEDRAKAQALASVLEKWAQEVREANLRAVLEEGAEIPGYKLAHRKGHRRVVAMMPLLEEIEKYGVTLSDFVSECSIPMGGVERLVSGAVISRGAELEPNLPEEIRQAMRGGVDAVLNQLHQNLEEKSIVQRGNEVFYLTKATKSIKKAE